MNEDVKELVDKKKKSYGDKVYIMNSPDFKDALFKERENDDSWNSIAKKLSEKFDIDLKPKTLENKYNQEVSITFSVDGYAEKQFTNQIRSMSQRYDRLARITDRLLVGMDKITERLSKADDEDLEGLTELIRMIKPLHTMNKAVLSQMDFIREEQDKIRKTMTAKKETTDEDIKAKVYKYIPGILDTLEKQGKIEIKDKDILK
ncbi:MAG: hypothetical protein ACOC5T_02270 [Elusimicrobiota bacterium]